MKARAKCLFLIITLLLTGSVFAGEKIRSADEPTAERTAARPALPEGAMAHALPEEREAAPLLYVLPELGIKEHATMEIRILQGKRLLIREMVSLPANVAAGRAVDVLFTHPDELKRLRTIEGQTPGSLRFISLIEGRVITDEPLGAIEAQGANASLDSAVGEVAEIEVKPAPRLRLQADSYYDEDPCWVDCNSRHDQCLDWCDPRSDECSRCETWYHDCIQWCPVPCSEPRSVSTYKNYYAQSAYWYGQSSCQFGQRYDYLVIHYRVDVFQRTEHCDGSHTDVYSYTYYEDVACWNNSYVPCSPSSPYFVSPLC
jgi:hypothetical protein